MQPVRCFFDCLQVMCVTSVSSNEHSYHKSVCCCPSACLRHVYYVADWTTPKQFGSCQLVLLDGLIGSLSAILVLWCPAGLSSRVIYPDDVASGFIVIAVLISTVYDFDDDMHIMQSIAAMSLQPACCQVPTVFLNSFGAVTGHDKFNDVGHSLCRLDTCVR